MRDDNFYSRITNQFDSVADQINLSRDIKSLLSQFSNEIKINFPIKKSDKSIEMIEGYRIQHNDVMGPYIGGLLLHPSITPEIMRSMALLTSLKAALANIPAGGSMGGICIDPSKYNVIELERIVRRYVFTLGLNIGPEYDIITPGITCNSQIMAWVHDTYISCCQPQERNRNKHICTGKPMFLGGTKGNDQAEAMVLIKFIRKWCQENRAFNKVSIQGFGPTGYWVAQELFLNGVNIISIEDKNGTIYNANGINPSDLADYVNKNKTFSNYPEGESISHNTFLSLNSNILVLTGAEDQINCKNATKIQANLIIEGIDNCVDPKCDEIFKSNSIDFIPSIVCNTGREIISYFEWLQNKRSEYWSLKEVKEKLLYRVNGIYDRVNICQNENKTTWRTAGLIVALSRLEQIYLRRCIFP